MELNDLLRVNGISSSDVAVVLHKTTLQPLRRLFPALVFERADLFDAYQSVHSDTATATLRKRPYFASFISLGPERMLFAGLFEIVQADNLPTAEIYADPRFQELAEAYGDVATAPAVNIAARERQVRFQVAPMTALAELRGRLQIPTPVGRTYVRLAENMRAAVAAITEEPITSPAPPDWREFIVTAAELRALPASWRARLGVWRGIYLIVDADGARYVGSAYGEDNLLGRWRTHIAGSQGVTAELAGRDPAGFRFSILELVSPVATVDEVVPVENTWKERLHTRKFGLNVN